MDTLAEIIDRLKAEGQALERDGVSRHFIEVIQSKGEVILGGNREGLLWLALQCLDLASRGVPGAHYHLDEHSMADRADVPLVIRVIESPWEGESGA